MSERGLPGQESVAPRVIRSGEWAGLPGGADYYQARLGDILVERVVWSDRGEEGAAGVARFRRPGYAWFRFWLPEGRQVVEKYYDPQGTLLGTQIDVCMLPVEVAGGLQARDLLLDIWISAAGRVTVGNEQAFEQAVREGVLTDDEAGLAERHVRELTRQIAKGRFPPALVRNWQVDAQKLRDSLSGGAETE
jgi:hypothetical protein